MFPATAAPRGHFFGMLRKRFLHFFLDSYSPSSLSPLLLLQPRSGQNPPLPSFAPHRALFRRRFLSFLRKPQTFGKLVFFPFLPCSAGAPGKQITSHPSFPSLVAQRHVRRSLRVGFGVIGPLFSPPFNRFFFFSPHLASEKFSGFELSPPKVAPSRMVANPAPQTFAPPPLPFSR